MSARVEVGIITTPTPGRTAMIFQACLGADKGVPSTLLRDGCDVLVVADDGKTVRFTSDGARP